MRIDLLLFAVGRETAGRASVDLDLPADATVDDLWGAVKVACPALLGLRASSRISVNREFAAAATRIREGDEVALIPPVSGG